MAQAACCWEASSRKVGNVHPGASFADTEFMDFVLSGAVLNWSFSTGTQPTTESEPHRSVGRSVYLAVTETKECVGSNTNLGIALLLVPLMRGTPRTPLTPDLRTSVAQQLSELTVLDAELVYRAVLAANPGGLGNAPQQDVREKPTVTLLEAMRLAADRDMVARQYANGFADVFDFGVPAFTRALAGFGCVEAAIIDSQFRWLATFPDSLIARKRGRAAAEDVQRRAREALALGGIATAEGRAAGVALDRHLRSDGNKLNPGTTADLITACLFVALRENKVTLSAPFRWNVPDWL
ncbi:MAG: triphosphoribosyl-dephospho-CoA synthase [Gemmata sp.]